jgi:hypothetical protein
MWELGWACGGLFEATVDLIYVVLFPRVFLYSFLLYVYMVMHRACVVSLVFACHGDGSKGVLSC